MSLDPDLLPERLHELADQVGPSRRIDVDRAVADARRTLTRRRRARGGAVLSTVALAGAAAAFSAGVLPGGGPAAPTATASPAASTAFPRTAQDPVAVGLSFGWLPPGLHAHTPSWPSATDVLESYLMVEADTKADPGNSELIVSETSVSATRLNLYTMPPGAMPHLDPPWTPGPPESDVAGPLIEGSPSWIETPDSGYYGPEGLGALVWKLPGGDWAVLRYLDGAHSGHGSGIFDRATITRIAQSVTQTTVPVALPLRITGALAQADVTEVQSLSSNGTNMVQPSYWLSLTFREAGAEIVLTVRGGVGLDNALPTQACSAPSSGPGLSLMACIDVEGTLPPALAAGGSEGLLDDVEFLDTLTTDVIQ